MGMQLPGELVSLLGWLGYSWPEADEEKLFEMGGAWLALADALPGPVSAAEADAARVWRGNRGEAVTAFQATWNAPDAPAANLATSAEGARHVGMGLLVCAGIVLALKISVIVQLTLLAIQIAQAVATAAATFGASLLEIPFFKVITGLILEQLFDQAISTVLNG